MSTITLKTTEVQPSITFPNILTLEEVANYLRLSKEAVERLARNGTLPGRHIEDSWRFLRTAIDEWIRGQDGRAILLQQAGAFFYDETLPQLRYEAYKQRGRPEVVTGEF